MGSEEAGGAVDYSYLEGFAAGDMRVVTEVLTLFREQAQAWQAELAAPGADWQALAHTIKGASRGIGAYTLGDACERAEAEGPDALPEVRAALAAAVADIEGYLTRIGGG